MPERFFHPSREKMKYSLLLFIILFVLLFPFIVYTRCPALVQCSEAEIRADPLCTQACSVNFGVLVLIAVMLASYAVPAALVHHRNR